MELLTLYWIIILPSIGSVFLFIGTFSTIIISVLYALSIAQDCPWHGYLHKKHLIAPILTLLIGVVIPDNRQMTYLIGGYAATNVENIEKLPKNVVNAANKFLEDYTEQPKK